MLCSLWRNVIGDKGASALAAVLKETQITTFRCAAAPECLLSCQRPLTRTCSLTAPTQPPGSLTQSNIGPEGGSALAAVLKETQITNLECAAASE